MAYDFSALTNGIKETEEHLEREFSNIRTGRAAPALLDNIKPEAYGTRTPLRELATVNVEDARTLRILVWDKAMNKEIEKAVTKANLGVSVSTDDQGVRVSFPDLTSERRELLAKITSEKLEQAKVAVRAHRTDALRKLEADEKAGDISKDELFHLKEEVQKIVDAGIKQFEATAERKRKEIAQ
ncbi:Ribosome recycling factor [hydrothermal vent metagenome]|uniref:Ribosome recycling factor n=1 Tax=hydrothermal vent metagenome TaxID=652676 RepID=A0A3B0VMW5_9ZZZZ